MTYHGTASNAICRWCGLRITNSANTRYHPYLCWGRATKYGARYDEKGKPIMASYSDAKYLEGIMGRGFFR